MLASASCTASTLSLSTLWSRSGSSCWRSLWHLAARGCRPLRASRRCWMSFSSRSRPARLAGSSLSCSACASTASSAPAHLHNLDLHRHLPSAATSLSDAAGGQSAEAPKLTSHAGQPASHLVKKAKMLPAGAICVTWPLSDARLSEHLLGWHMLLKISSPGLPSPGIKQVLKCMVAYIQLKRHE